MKIIWLTIIVAVVLVMGLRLLTGVAEHAVDESSRNILAEETAQKAAAKRVVKMLNEKNKEKVLDDKR